VAPHREAILDAWQAEISLSDISDILVAAGAKGCGRQAVHLLIMHAREAGDPRAAPRSARTEAHSAKISAARLAFCARARQA
jgi:hypothetical protein